MSRDAATSFVRNINTAQNARAAGVGVRIGSAIEASRQANIIADRNRAVAAERAKINRQLGKMRADEVRRAASAEIANAVANAAGVRANTGTPLSALVEFAKRSELRALLEEFSFEVQATDIANRASISSFGIEEKARTGLGAAVIEGVFDFGEIGRSQPKSTKKSRMPAVKKRTSTGTIVR
jgi:hypothetical protein